MHFLCKFTRYRIALRDEFCGLIQSPAFVSQFLDLGIDMLISPREGFAFLPAPATLQSERLAERFPRKDVVQLSGHNPHVILIRRLTRFDCRKETV